MPSGSDVVQIFRELDQINWIQIGLIIVIAWLLIVGIERLLPWLAGKAPHRFRLYILPSVPVLRLVILIVAIVLIVPMIIEPTFQNFVAIFGAAAVAIGFAFKDYASSLVAGVVSIYERPYRPGDWVEIDGAYGEVRSMGLRAMSLVTPDDTVVTVPYTKLWHTNIYNANDGRWNHLCVADFYLQPRHDAALVRQKLYDVALTSPYIQLERPIMVVVAEKPWGTHYRLKAYPVDSRDQFYFTTDLTVRGKAVLTQLGIEPAAALPAVTNQQAADSY